MHRCKEWFYFSNFFLFFRPNKRIDQLPLPCGCLFATTAAADATFLRAETVAVPHYSWEEYDYSGSAWQSGPSHPNWTSPNSRSMEHTRRGNFAPLRQAAAVVEIVVVIVRESDFLPASLSVTTLSGSSLARNLWAATRCSSDRERSSSSKSTISAIIWVRR